MKMQLRKINLESVLGAIWANKIKIILVALCCCILVSAYTVAFVTPKYQADILLFVNNNSVSLGSSTLTFSSSELSAAREMLDTYLVVLKSRQCLDKVIDKADLPYSRGQLKGMISAGSVNDTEVFSIVVTSTDPNEAQVIANTISEVLPDILTKTITGSSVVVIDSAVKPKGKVSPNVTKQGLNGFAIGIALACAFVFIRVIFDDKVHDENSLIELDHNIPVLANIPHKGMGSKYYKYGYKKYGYDKYGYKKSADSDTQKSKSFDDITNVCGDLDFAAAETYKLLQSSVQYSFENDGCKVIGITSSERNEGKSTLAINLAYMLSCDKQKVLLLEGDMRLPSISKKLGIESAPGLSDYLTGKAKNNEGIQHSEKAPALSVICSGVIPPNPFGLLGSASMERLLTALKECYDYIIVDLPPVNIVSDPLSISKFLDGFIVVARSEFSTTQGVDDVVKKLQIVNANILGYVINSDGSSHGKKYGKYYKYSNYKKYGYSDKDYEKSYDNSAKKNRDKTVSLDSYSEKNKKS